MWSSGIWTKVNGNFLNAAIPIWGSGDKKLHRWIKNNCYRGSNKNRVDYLGDHELGEGSVEVHVEVAVENTIPLIRPYGVYKTIGDAVGKPIAWPESLVRWSITINPLVFIFKFYDWLLGSKSGHIIRERDAHLPILVYIILILWLSSCAGKGTEDMIVSNMNLWTLEPFSVDFYFSEIT